MKNPLKRIYLWGRKTKSASDNQSSNLAALAGVDEETLEIARELAYEKRLRRDVNAKWKRGRKGADVTDDEVLEALRELKPTYSQIMSKVFARTVEDTVLANRFVDGEGKTVSHLTLKKAVAMDGLRDIDDDVRVSPSAATPMNPEGRFNVPVSCASNHQFAERFNEAMNPVRNGGRMTCVIPEMIMDHYGNYSTFIGYPMCGLIACHPTVSNACTIPGEDAMAPGYRLSFVDSEDLNGNGIPDELEAVELGGVRRSLGRIGAMEALKDAIVTLSKSETDKDASAGGGASLDALALALERLAAYEEWERTDGAGDDAATAVNEGFVQPVSKAFSEYANKPGEEKERKAALAALSLALSDLAKKEHPVLDEVRSTRNRRETITAVKVAVETISQPEGTWDSVKSLNDLAVAVERVAAYEKFSDRNAEALASLNMALIDLSTKEKPDAKEAALRALNRAVEAMDADDFDFVDPNAIRQMPQTQMQGSPQMSEFAPSPEQVWNQQHAEQLERERQEDRKTKAELAARNAEAKEGRINDLHRQKMAFLQQQALAKQQAAENLAGVKGRSLEAQEARAEETHRQKMDIAQQMAEQKLRQQQEQFEAQQQQAMAAQQNAQAQQEEAAKQKKEKDEKRTETRIAAEVAKERQKHLDRWKQRATDMGINDVCIRMARNARVFGIGIAVPVVDGVNYEDPMDIDSIREGAYRGFTVIEPTWIYPEVDSSDLINPLSSTFFEPTYWAVTGSSSVGSMGVRRIHKSWMVIVRNKEVPTMLRPMYYFGGLSLCQEIYEAVFCADKLMNEVPKLAMTKRSVIVKGDPNDLITNPEGVVERLQAMSQVQDNFGYKFVGRNADVVQLETSLSEFDQVIAKANQRVAAIAQMPESKLFKAQVAGAFSPGVYEMRDYWELLRRIQNNWFKPLLTMHFKMDTKSRIGKAIDIKVDFNALDVPTDSEKGEAESRSVQTLNSAIQGGWLAPAEARTIARGSEDSMFSAISAEMPEELEQAQQQQQMQGGGMPGMPMPGGEGGGDGGDNLLAAMMGGANGGNGGGGDDGMPQEPESPEEPESPKDPVKMKEPKGLEEPKEPSAGAPKIKGLPKA